jgi:hypothetical protein
MPSSITLVKWKIGVEEYVHKETREIHHVCEKANESKDLNVKNFGVKQDFDQKILKINVIGPNPPTLQKCEELWDKLERQTLLACSDGAYDPVTSIGSHGWTFHSNIPHNIASGACPVDGSPSQLSFYRAELCGILAVLYIIYRICMYYRISLGTVKCYCDNKGVVKNSFSTLCPGILPFMNSDYDLLHLIHQILHIIPVNIVGLWVKGHFVGPNPEVQHSLNEIADTLATTYQHN